MIALICSALEDSSDKEFMLWIYENFNRMMFATARKYVKDQQACEDVVQDSLIRLIDKVDVLRGKERPVLASYIICTIKSVAFNHLNRQKSKNNHTIGLDISELEEPPAPYVPLEELIHKKDAAKQLLSVLEELPEADWILLEGKYILEYTDDELAKLLDCKPSSIRMKLTRARRSAQALLCERLTREEMLL